MDTTGSQDGYPQEAPATAGPAIGNPVPGGWALEQPAAAPVGPAPRRGRRYGALALGLALVGGGGAGAVSAALISGGTATAVTTTTPVLAANAAATTSGAEALVADVEPALVDIHTSGTSSDTSSLYGNGLNPFGGGTTTTEAAGTGMVLTSNGLVLTNAHVIAGADTITVTLNGQTSTHTATLVGEDAAKDVALIKVAGVSGLPTVTLADSSKVRSGDVVLAIGNALDLKTGGFTVSEGIISGTGRSITTDNNESLSGLLQTDAAISSGDSGGPLVNAAGQVIGMDTAAATSSSTDNAANIGFSIPASEISSLIPQLEHGSIGATTTGSGNSSSSSSSSSDGSSGQGGYSDGSPFSGGYFGG